MQTPGERRSNGDLQRLAALVSPLEVFKATPESALLPVMRLVGHVKLPAGAMVCEQGEDGDAMYVIVTGAVSVHTRAGHVPLGE